MVQTRSCSSTLACLALVGCSGAKPRLVEVPEVVEARSLLIAVQSSAGLSVVARTTETAGPLYERELEEDERLLVSLVYFADELERLGLAPGPIAARSPLDPLPRFLELHQLTIEGGEPVGSFERTMKLEEPLSSFLYPHPEGCTEVTRGGRTYCVPNGCPGNCEREFCYEAPTPWMDLDSPYFDDGVAAVREGSEVWLYFSTRRWTASSTSSQGRGDHAKVRLRDAFTAELDTLTRLDHLPETGLDYVARPSISRDGLELVFSTFPTGASAEQVYLSHRASVAEPFSTAEFAIAGLEDQDMMDPLILMDPTIVLLWSGVPDKLTLFRRSSTEAGALDFSAEISLTPTLSPDPFMRLGAVASYARPNISCDGWHLLLFRKLGDDIVPTTTLVAKHAPLELGGFEAVDDLRPEPGRVYTTWAEHPDCTAAYLSDGERLYIAKRRACTP